LGYPVQHTIKKIGAYRVAYLPKGDLVPHALKMAWDAVQKGDVYLHPALVNEKYPDAARVFIQSRPAEMRQWIETACERMPLLSERETQVLELWGRGHNARAIGQLLSIHHRTVYDHINNIRAELLSDFKMNAENEQSNQTDALQVIKNTVIRDALILYDLIPPTFKTTK
jgi:DNA-binding NarL/FixJ family response regulator